MNLVWLVLTLAFATILGSMLTDLELQNKKSLYQMWLFAGFMIIFDSYIWLSFGHETFMKFYPFLAQIPLFIVFLFISKHKGIKLVFIHLTIIAIVSSIVLLAVLISGFWNLSETQMNLTALLLYLPTGFITYKFFRPYILYMLRNTDKGWWIFCIIPLTYTMITYSYSKYDMTSVISGASLLPIARGLIFTLISYIMILWIFKQNREQLALQNEQSLLRMQILASKQNLELLAESQEKTIVYRHDMRHHLKLIDSYLEDSNNKAAREYIAEVKEAINDSVIENYCENYTVNLILSSFISKARSEGISVETRVHLSENTYISDMDLCVVFSNALENAINACKKVQDKVDKNISIICKIKENRTFIQITNNYQENVVFVDDFPVSQEEGHGLGTKSISAVAHKYGGICSFAAENGIFKASIIL